MDNSRDNLGNLSTRRSYLTKENLVSILLSGWGRYQRFPTNVVHPSSLEAAEKHIKTTQACWVPRGLGRSYGDAALAASGKDEVILGTGLDRILEFKADKGVLTAEAGVSLDTIIKVFQPQGWFLPTTPGSKFISLGGAVAADVHGKNHHQNSSFGTYVKAITIMNSQGDIFELSPEKNPRWFWATVGGMGLTGFILSVSLQLVRVPSAWYRVKYEKAKNLKVAIRRLAEENKQHQYMVAWLDCFATGSSLGRGVLMFGNHANPEELPSENRDSPWESPRHRINSISFDFPEWVIQPWSVKKFNQLLYFKNSLKKEKIINFESFFYPLDTLRNWNRLYGQRGFIQFQVVFPDETAEKGLLRILETVNKSPLKSFLAVLKKFGPSGKGLLSFPRSGYTLSLDFPNTGLELKSLHGKLEKILLEEKGRLYLAKDTLSSGKNLDEMYPQLMEFLKVRQEMDPTNKVRSRLSHRLKIVGFQ